MVTVMPHVHFQYVCNKSAKFQFDPLIIDIKCLHKINSKFNNPAGN